MSVITILPRSSSRQPRPRYPDHPPVDFNPAAHPIIARHFFGVEPCRPVGQDAPEIVANMKFRHQVLRLHSLGPRAVGELLAELSAERSIMTLVDRKLNRYAGIEPEALEVTGGNGFWPVPLREA